MHGRHWLTLYEKASITPGVFIALCQFGAAIVPNPSDWRKYYLSARFLFWERKRYRRRLTMLKPRRWRFSPVNLGSSDAAHHFLLAIAASQK
jgi:hypothetical protein